MKMFVGTVVDQIDTTKTGIIRVSVDGLMASTESVPVLFTTAAAGPLGGGIVAPVEKGSRVIIASSDNDDYFYYLGSVVTVTPKATDNAFSKGDVLTSTGMTTREGAGLTMDVEIDENDHMVMTRLKGSGGQGQVVINNHPGNESVTMQAQGMNTSIKATGFSNTKPDQIEINAANSVTSRARKGANYINVGPQGGEIKIHNEGTPYSPLRLSNPMSVFNGDIRIESENNNVVIKSCTDPTLVATDSPLGGGISLQAGSIAKPLDPLVEIRVDSQGFVNIIGATGINMEATTGNVEISAPAGQVNIRSGLPTNGVNLQPPQPALPIPPAKR